MTDARRMALLAIAAMAISCHDDARPRSIGPLGSMRRPMYGGAADTVPAHAAVVFIDMNNGDGFCSGTLIAPSWVLTAGHCTIDDWTGNTIAASKLKVYFGDDCTDTTNCTASTVSEVHTHPSYFDNWNNDGLPLNDIGILKLTTPKTGVTPIPYFPSSLAATFVDGSTVDFSGFGEDEQHNFGVKLHFSGPIITVCETAAGCGNYPTTNIALAPHDVYYAQQTGGPCSGDSGGPAFFVTGGQEYVAGVTSYGDTDCTVFGTSTYTADFADFISGYVAFPVGHACAVAGDCASGHCASAGMVCCNSACDAPCGACTVALGSTADGLCTPLAGTTCTDANACTLNDACSAGACVGTPKACGPAVDTCHLAPTCNPANGNCVAGVAVADGTTCTDGEVCTQGDHCLAGVCTGTTKACPAPDACHQAGQCVAGVGCPTVFPVQPDGTACDDGDQCTSPDACLAGACHGAAKVCAADQCRAAGACVPATGLCDGTPKADGTACDDDDPCTTADQCVAGVCRGTARSCPGDQCRAAGTCDSATGLCNGAPKPNGTSCNDGNACTTGDSCTDGTCTGTLKSCPAPSVCHKAGQCDWQTGNCVTPVAANGTACTDTGIASGECQAGLCVAIEVPPDAGSSGGGDGGATPVVPKGCGCASAGAPSAPGLTLLALSALAMVARRRRLA